MVPVEFPFTPDDHEGNNCKLSYRYLKSYLNSLRLNFLNVIDDINKSMDIIGSNNYISSLKIIFPVTILYFVLTRFNIESYTLGYFSRIHDNKEFFIVSSLHILLLNFAILFPKFLTDKIDWLKRATETVLIDFKISKLRLYKFIIWFIAVVVTYKISAEIFHSITNNNIITINKDGAISESFSNGIIFAAFILSVLVEVLIKRVKKIKIINYAISFLEYGKIFERLFFDQRDYSLYEFRIKILRQKLNYEIIKMINAFIASLLFLLFYIYYIKI